MSWFLNAIYFCFLVVASPWLLWRRFAHGKNRRGWFQKMFGIVEPRCSDKDCIWMHAVSVGEVILLEPIIKCLSETHPDIEVVISTTTETGYDLAMARFSDHYVFFCPFDFSWAIRRVVKDIRPTMLMLAELELWPNLIRTTKQANVAVAVVNGRMSENSFRGYSRFCWLLGPVLRSIDLIAAQNETYANRFIQLGCSESNVVVTGSVKFDGVETDCENAATQRLRKLIGITPEQRVFVAGSTQPEEDLMAARVYRELVQSNPELRLILVPRHPERCGALKTRLEEMGLNVVLRSSLQGFGSLSLSSPEPTVFVVDVIGELGAWWGCADMAYVGGSMGSRGGQNMLEPAAYGIPVSFGPNTENFKTIVGELLAGQAAVVVENETELRAFVSNVIGDQPWASTLGQRAKNVVLAHIGASQRTVEALSKKLDRTVDGSANQATDHSTSKLSKQVA